MTKVTPVIMCGGSGTRLWPLSRPERPKQYLSLVGDLSLFQSTLQRFSHETCASPLVLVNNAHLGITLSQLEGIGADQVRILAEPCARSTAPAIAAAALLLHREDPDAMLLVTPADHFVGAPDLLLDAINRGVPAAHEGFVVTFGIEPQYPETGYGYIGRYREKIVEEGVYIVRRFTEKPSLDVALELINDGDHYWASGIMLFKVKTILDEFRRHAPDILLAVQDSLPQFVSGDKIIHLDRGAYQEASEISLEYAVVERCERIAVVPVNPGWSDVGSWSALWDLAEKDEQGNYLSSSCVALDTRNSYVFATSGRHVAVQGLEDVVIVENETGILVTARSMAQNVKEILKHLPVLPILEDVARFHDSAPPSNSLAESVDIDSSFSSVRRLEVDPEGPIELLSGLNEIRRYIVIDGFARVEMDNDIRIVSVGETFGLEAGQSARFTNLGLNKLSLAEVICHISEGDSVEASGVGAGLNASSPPVVVTHEASR